MGLTINDKALLDGLNQLIAHIFAGAEKGLAQGSNVPEQMMQTYPAHGDITGAAHSSSRVYLIGGGHDGAAEAASGYSEAQSLINNSIVSHGGKALSEDSGVVINQNERGLIYTRFVDYADKLEKEGKAVIQPVLEQTAELMTQYAADGIKAELS